MSSAAWSADLPVAGGGRHVWMAAPDTDSGQPITHLFHADVTAEPPLWGPAVELQGRVAGGGLVAEGDRLWLIFNSGAVRKLTLTPGTLADQWHRQTRTLPSLPPGVQLRAAAAGGDRLWVVVRAETAETLAAVDALAAPAMTDPREVDEQAEFNRLLGLPPNFVLEPEDETDVGSDVEAASGNDGTVPAPEDDAASGAELPGAGGSAGEEIDVPQWSAEAKTDPAGPGAQPPADRLLMLDRSQWKPLPLPDDWPLNLPLHLAAPAHADATRPVLLLEVDDAVRLYRWEDGSWSAAGLPTPGRGATRPLRVAGQLLLVTHQASARGVAGRGRGGAGRPADPDRDAAVAGRRRGAVGGAAVG